MAIAWVNLGDVERELRVFSEADADVQADAVTDAGRHSKAYLPLCLQLSVAVLSLSLTSVGRALIVDRTAVTITAGKSGDRDAVSTSTISSLAAVEVGCA